MNSNMCHPVLDAGIAISDQRECHPALDAGSIDPGSGAGMTLSESMLDDQ